MRVLSLLLSLLVLSACPALASWTVTWDFDTAVDPLLLGSYGGDYVVSLDPTMNHGGGTGNAMKVLVGPGGTVQLYLAGVWGLNDNDQVIGGFWRFDDTPNGDFTPDSPACRVWGHYNDTLPFNLEGFNGSASGNFDYGPGTGWDYTEYTWTVFPGHTGIMLECRAYYQPGDIIWIDDFRVTVPDHAWVITPEGTYEPPIQVEPSSWGQLKSLYR
jgi:hypothetical protein